MTARSHPSPGTRSGWLALSGALLLLLGYGPARAGSPAPAWLEAGVQASQDGEQRSTPTNEWCLVLTDERVDPEIHTEYRGQQFFFCCRKCLKQFQADPTAYAANLSAGAPASEVARVPREDSSRDQHGGDAEQAHAHGVEGAEQASAGESGHDHAAHSESTAHGMQAAILWMGRLHPMWVHFPIALLLVAALAELLAARSGDPRFSFAARYTLWAGAIGSLVAAPLGWADALAVAEDYTGTSATLLFYHRWAGTTTAALALLALVLCERFHRGGSPGRRRLYRLTLFAAAVLVTVTGHLGASLVFGWNYLSR